MQSRTIAGHSWLEATDLDGVGAPDVIIPMNGRGPGGLLALAGSDGSVLWEAKAEAIQWNLRGSNLVDVTSDGVQDILVGFGEKIRGVGVLNGSDGEILWQREGGSAGVRRRRPGDPPVLLVSRKGGLDIVDPSTGEVSSSIDLEGYGGIGGTMFSDWDGDGEVELVAPQGERKIAIFDETGKKEGSLSLPVRTREIIPSGDMNGDGVDDLLIEAAGPTVIVGPKVLWSRTAADALRATPVLEDLDGDGDLELAAFGVWGRGEVLHIYDAATGELQAVGQNQSGVIRGALAIPAPGGGHDILAQSFRGGALQLYSGRDATILKQHETGATYGIPGYGDVDGDGRMEIVAVPWNDDLLRVLDAETWELEWTVPLEIGGWVEPKIANVDGKGPPELLLGFNNGMFHVFDGSSGAQVWSKNLGPLKVDHAAAVGDLDGDGRLEAIISTADQDQDVLILDAATGREKRRLKGIGSPLPVILLDVDEDGLPELLVPSHTRGALCLKANGDEVWRFDVTPAGEDPVPVGAPMTLTDLEDDGRQELLATFRDGALRVLDAKTGELRWTFHTQHPKIESAPVAGDVDGDGKKEVFLGSYDRHLYALRGGH
jgi:outer membrane protein assembly factor BamB